MNGNKIKIGTRGSRLALVQTDLVVKELEKYYPEMECEIVIIRTIGDKILDKPLEEFGGKAVFVSEFEEALLRNEIDLAVHSAKDMPMELGQGLDIIGVLKREDPRDVLVTTRTAGDGEKRLPNVGTSSLRRQIQIEELYSDIKCSPIRGNVNTRMDKLKEGKYDGIVLAAAGINRLKLDNEPECIYRYFEIDEMIPAAGQAIIAVEGKKNNKINGLLEKITDPVSKIELETERRALELLDAGCHEPIGVYSEVNGDEITIWMIKELDGRVIKKKESTTVANRFGLVKSMADNILEEV